MRLMLGAWVACTLCIGLLGDRQAACSAEPSAVPSAIDLSEIPTSYQDRAQVVLNRPSMHVFGPSGEFQCDPKVYHWLLDHPDKAAKAWQRLGAKCADIMVLGPGHFAWEDDRGSSVHWYSIVRTGQRRAWYVEGSVRPALLMPKVPIRALMVLHVEPGRTVRERTSMRHKGELYVHTSSRAIRLATRLLGGAGPRMAQDYVGQIETFFGALAKHLSQHPEKWQEVLSTGERQK